MSSDGPWVDDEFISTSGSRAPYRSRSPRTWVAITSRKLLPGLTSSSDFGPDRPMLVPSPPLSLSHALFGGLIGATLVAAGTVAVNFGAVLTKVIIPALISPLLAGLVALIATYLAYRTTQREHDGRTKKGFKVGQIVSASMVALAHGTNDAQKTMGIITLTLITAGVLSPDSGPPFWVILSAGLAIALGTYMGGWRIIQ